MKNVLIISGINWNSTRQRHHQIAEALIENGYKVDFLEGVKSSSISIQNIRSLLFRVFSENKVDSKNPISKGVNVLSAFNIPSSSRLCGLINEISVRKLSKNLSQEYDLIICYVPSYFSYSIIKSVTCNKLIYDCVRNFSDWKGIDSSIICYEKKISDKSDKILVDSFFLKDRFKDYNVEQLLPTISNLNIRKPLLLDLSFKINNIGFFGTIGSHFDVNTIYDLMDRGFKIHFWGRDEIGIEHKNFIEHGYVDSEIKLLRAIFENVDAIIIPYIGNMDGVIPAKLIQSLGLGLPVYCSSFYDSRYLADCLNVYNTASDLLDQLINPDISDLNIKLSVGYKLAKNNTDVYFNKNMIRIVDE